MEVPLRLLWCRGGRRMLDAQVRRLPVRRVVSSAPRRMRDAQVRRSAGGERHGPSGRRHLNRGSRARPAERPSARRRSERRRVPCRWLRRTAGARPRQPVQVPRRGRSSVCGGPGRQPGKGSDRRISWPVGVIPFHVDVLETVSLGQRTPPARPSRRRRALRPAHGARHAIAGHKAVPPSYGPDGMPGRIGAGGLRRSPMPMTPASGTQAPSELLPVAAVIASPPGRRDECREHGSARRAGSRPRSASRHEWRCTEGTGSRRYRHRPR